jgi:large subunit ribosomal protein L17e
MGVCVCVCAVAKASQERVSVQFKSTREVCRFIQGKKVTEAITYLEDVLEGKRGIPFNRYTGGIARHGCAKNLHTPGNTCRFPQKPTKAVIALLKNLLANAEINKLVDSKADLDQLQIVHSQANQAIKSRRRTYRAHGRIGPYQGRPAHIELVARRVDREADEVEKADAPAKRLSRARAARIRLANGAKA